MTCPALNPDLDDLIADLLARMKQVLGDQFQALYLYGSLVTGDFDPDVSDIDTLAVLRSTLTDNELEALRVMHSEFAVDHPAWDNRIEVAYVPAEALGTFRTRESAIAAISPGEPFHAKQAGREWLINWWIVREQGVTIFGPPPETFIGPITRDEFLDNVRLHAHEWTEWVHDYHHLPGQGYAIVTGCRAMYALEHGRQGSKNQAAAWAQARFPEWADVIARGFNWTRLKGEWSIDPEEAHRDTVRFVRFVETEIGSGRLGSVVRCSS
jgi:hypothetical protein